MEKIALGIDIGGTNTAFGLVDSDGKILHETTVPTSDFSSVSDMAKYIFDVVNSQVDVNKLAGIGIGAPNGNQETGTIDFAPNLPWKGIIQITQLFEDQFKVKTNLVNDANAAAIGEKLFGSAKNVTDFVIITLGTGLGSGIFTDNKLTTGKHGLAGEYGHIRVEKDGRLCGCGRNGCLETYVSATGVSRSVYELESDNKTFSKLRFLEKPSAKDIFDLAQENDLFALEIVDYTADILGNALADFAAFSDPEVFILFGGLVQSGDFFLNKVIKVFDDNLLNIYKGKIEVRNSHLDKSNGAILGACASVFWDSENFKK